MRTSLCFVLASLATLALGCAPTDSFGSGIGPALQGDGEPTVLSSEDDGKADGAGQVVFLNFGGARIHHGDSCSDAPNNCSSLVSGTQDFAPFTLDQQSDRGKTVAAITSCVGQFYDDMNLSFVTTRPRGGNYTMMMIGAIYPTQLGFQQNGQGPYGRAPVDCGNSNKNDIGFLLLENDINPDFYYMCRSIAHELGHSFGMQHVHGANTVTGSRVDMMCESDECRNAAASGAVKWDTINKSMPSDTTACDGSDQQNTYARLMDTLGVRGH